VRFAILAVALLIAWRASRAPDLRRYFAVQLAAAIAIYAALLSVSEHSHWYVTVFILSDLAVFAAMIPLAWEALSQHPMRFVAVFNGLAIGTGLAVISAIGRDMTHYQWIGAVAGAFLVMCAVSTGMGAAYLSGTSRRIAISLMALWFAQSLYEFGFTLHIDEPGWITLNEFLPAMILASGCLWLALFCRSEKAHVER
jgi:hypothetical protein